MSSVTREVALRGSAVLGATLLVVGLVTGGILHGVQVRALDRALIAAASSADHQDDDEAWRPEHLDPPIRAWVVESDDPRVPRELAERALRRERPEWWDDGRVRRVLLVVERSHEQEEDDEEEHRLVAAEAASPTPLRTVGPFALVYLLVAAGAAAVSVPVLRRTVERALVPLRRARDEADRVLSLGQGQRLTEDAPEEVRALLVGLNALLDRLDAAHAAQSRFTAEAAHELRTPVTAMLGELDVTLRRERTPEQYRETLGSMREEVDRLRRLVEGLLALTRLDAGEVEGVREPARASELLAAAARAEQAELERAGCPVRVEVVDDPELQVHRALVEVALGNLLRNAARHAPGTPVTARVRVEGPRVVFEIDDRGPGVAPADREAVFDRFARAGEARRRDREGLGLGLPIAREIARRSGGDCVIGEAPGGGARVTFTLRR